MKTNTDSLLLEFVLCILISGLLIAQQFEGLNGYPVTAFLLHMFCFNVVSIVYDETIVHIRLCKNAGK